MPEPNSVFQILVEVAASVRGPREFCLGTSDKRSHVNVNLKEAPADTQAYLVDNNAHGLRSAQPPPALSNDTADCTHGQPSLYAFRSDFDERSGRVRGAAIFGTSPNRHIRPLASCFD